MCQGVEQLQPRRSGPRTKGFITIEFFPNDRFPILAFPMSETSKGFWRRDIVLGQWCRKTEEERGGELQAVAAVDRSHAPGPRQVG